MTNTNTASETGLLPNADDIASAERFRRGRGDGYDREVSKLALAFARERWALAEMDRIAHQPSTPSPDQVERRASSLDWTIKNAREWIEEGTTVYNGEEYMTGWAIRLKELLAALAAPSPGVASIPDGVDLAAAYKRARRNARAAIGDDSRMHPWHVIDETLDAIAIALAAAPEPQAGGDA